MLDFTKSEKKELRTLSAIAYEKELALELEKLFQEFLLWKNKQLRSLDLDEKIHGYHSDAHRSLFNMYNQNSNFFPAVARAVGLGLIFPEQVSTGLFAKIEPSISFFRGEFGSSQTMGGKQDE
jgi:hypothetical protein